MIADLQAWATAGACGAAAGSLIAAGVAGQALAHFRKQAKATAEQADAARETLEAMRATLRMTQDQHDRDRRRFRAEENQRLEWVRLRLALSPGGGFQTPGQTRLALYFRGSHSITDVVVSATFGEKSARCDPDRWSGIQPD